MTCKYIFIAVIEDVIKRTFGHVRPAKIKTILHIRTVWSKLKLGTFRIAKDVKFLHSDNEDSDQNARMRRLIRVFIGRSWKYVSWRFGSEDR